MGSGGKVFKHESTRRKVRSKDQGSDESDEDFTIGEGDEYESDEYCSSLDPDESEEGLAEFELEEEEEVEMKVKKATRSNARKSVPAKRGKKFKRPQKKKKRFSYKQEEDDDFSEDDDDVEFKPDDEVDYVDDEDETPKKKKKRVSYKQEEEEEEYDDDDLSEDDDDVEFKPDDEVDCVEDEAETPTMKKKRVLYKQKQEDGDFSEDEDDVEFKLDEEIDYVDETPEMKKKSVSYNQEDDGDYDDGDDDAEDEEFTVDGFDFVDEEDETAEPKKKKKVSKCRSWETRLAKGRKRKRNNEVMKKSTATWKKPRTNRRLVKNTSSGSAAVPKLVRKTSSGSGGEFADKSLVVEERSKKIPGRRRRRYVTVCDSDFMSSGSSDYEYTISEEEREQVKEANKLCTSLATGLRSSSSSMKVEENEDVCKQRKRPQRKGKEKVEALNKEVVKQVCGICLSEEGKRTIRGILNCCDHFFCFACIMEWSKVESRCPLCKQRFVTISKSARSETGFDLRTVVLQVPECDQVYQPSEEELRGYLDPYDGVICTECQQGGDDALMLLCDICDSPAHTYCVGLGREVPDGNWYCEGCRPAACGPNPHGLNPTPDQTATNYLSSLSSPVHNIGELDLNSMYVPDTPLTQETGGFPFPRRVIGEFHAASSPTSGLGAFTVFERRRIQSHIHGILLNNRRNPSSSQSNGIAARNSGFRLFGSQIDRGAELAFQRAITPERGASHYTSPLGRLQESSRTFTPIRDTFSARSSQLSEQGRNNPLPMSINGMLQAEHEGNCMGFNSFNSGSTFELLNPCSSRPNSASDGRSPYGFREVRNFPVEKGQVQQMVRSHLKSLSREIELDHDTFKDIARSSTHTILAACGHEHRGNEVYPVQGPSACNHVERPTGVLMSLIEGCCSSCFDLFVKNVVREIMNMRVSPSVIRFRN